MEIIVNGKCVFVLNNEYKKILLHEMNFEQFDNQFKDLVINSILDRIRSNSSRLIQKWMPELKKRYEMLPTDDKKLVELILSQRDYKSMEEEQIERNMKNNSNFKVL